jgi:hypothetical protein
MSTLFCLAVLMLIVMCCPATPQPWWFCRLNLRVVGSRELCSSDKQRFASPTKAISVPASTVSKAPKPRRKFKLAPRHNQLKSAPKLPPEELKRFF